MKNILIILTFFVFAAWLSTVVFLFQEELTSMVQKSENQNEIETASWDIVEQDIIEEDSIFDREAIVQQKIETIKKRLALKGLIIQWDTYFRNQQLPLALKKYLEFYKQNPWDDLIIQKLADTYFDMKKYGSALNYYTQLTHFDAVKRKSLMMSFLYSSDIWEPTFPTTLSKFMNEYNFPEQEVYYYTQSTSCLLDFHTCKEWFEAYFGTLWPDWDLIKIDYAPLLDISAAIENYKNFQVDGVYLKNAYLIASWYSSWYLPLAIELGKDLLEEKKWYKPVLKIISQSYFELWEYEKARETLWEFYKIDETDPAIAYMLWVVNEKLKEYILANIYFNKALTLWYMPSISVRRQIIHNFYLLDNTVNLLSSFKDLIEKESVIEENDLWLAIYYHIIHDKLEQALIWSKKWNILFPESWDFYAYEWWILREQWRLKEALDVLTAGTKIDASNQFIYINIAYTLAEIKNTPASLIYFKKVVALDAQTEYGIQAQKEIDLLTKK